MVKITKINKKEMEVIMKNKFKKWMKDIEKNGTWYNPNFVECINIITEVYSYD